MKWVFLNTGYNSGKYNMDFDMSLAQNCRDDEAFIRLYRWKPFCISLGANQSFNSINLDKASRHHINVVKRPTGGRAILHSEELTYSVVTPLNKISSLRKLYFEINEALREGLILYNNRLSTVSLESNRPDIRNLYKHSVSEVCFAISAKSEIQFEGKKLIGSAQRRINKSVLQQGSILCGDHHRIIAEFLRLSDEDFIETQKEIAAKTTELETILKVKTNYDRLGNCIIKGFVKYFNIKFVNITFQNPLFYKEQESASQTGV